jgi:glycosidase
VVLSDSDYLSWQWSHEMAHDYFQRFESEADQKRVASFLRDRIDADARLYSMLPHALRYMTSRPVVDILLLDSQASTSQVRYDKRYIVLTPMIGTYLYLRPESAIWIEQHTRLVMQFGRYSIYKLDAGTDKDLLNIKVDRNIYRGHPESDPWFGRR